MIFEEDQAFTALRRDYAENKTGNGIIVILGSGLSQPLVPLWEGLKHNLIAEAERIAAINKASESLIRPFYEKAKVEVDPWGAFSLLKRALGASWGPTIQNSIKPVNTGSVPPAYRQILGLNLRGIVSLNLDDLLLRELRNHESISFDPVYGKEVTRRFDVIRNSKPFLYLPHGYIESESSWVLTSEDLEEIFSNKMHAELLRSVFLMNTVLFIGVSAADIGASGRLVQARAEGIATPRHYWFCSDAHSVDREWAQKHNVAQIMYRATDGHAESLSHFLDLLGASVSMEIVDQRPVVGKHKDSIAADLSSDKLYKLDDIDEIRIELNRRMNSILQNGMVEFSQYMEFVKEYERAIHTAYMLPKTKGDSAKWFKYAITGETLGGRTTSVLYPAVDESGNRVVIKILEHGRYTDEMYLSAFRRGVKSQRIINKREVCGSVEIVDAYEIPPTIIMKYIENEQLSTLVSAAAIDLFDCIKILIEVCNTIHAGHIIPETVLHRDIRPSNILVSDFDWGLRSWSEVVIVDYDLSWHSGAVGEDFVRTDSASIGYQAPEQIDQILRSKRLTRNTKVDSYGIGATLAFCAMNENPPPRASGDERWRNRLRNSLRRKLGDHKYFAHPIFMLICRLLEAEPDKRLSVADCRAKLLDFQSWIQDRKAECSNRMICELLASSLSDGSYDSDGTESRFSWVDATGVESLIYLDDYDGVFKLSMNYVKQAHVQTSKLDGRLRKIRSELSDLFNFDSIINIEKVSSPSRDIEVGLTLVRSGMDAELGEIISSLRAYYRYFDFR